MEPVQDASAATVLERRIKRSKSRRTIARCIRDPRNGVRVPVGFDFSGRS